MIAIFELRSISRNVPALRRYLATHAPSPPPLTAVAEKQRLKQTRHDWSKQEIQEIYDTPLLELVFRAASVHRQYHDPSKVQLCTLMNIKSMFEFEASLSIGRH